MKAVLIYIGCTMAILTALVLLLGGGWWSLSGLCVCLVLYLSGEIYPLIWKRFWILNIKILAFFNCL